MEPLSVTASIVGILYAAAQVAPVLSSFVRNPKGAPKLAQAVLDEVNGLSAVLSQLQTFLLGTASSSRSRASLILVEQVLVTLAECVITFSELEDVLEIARIETDFKLFDRVKWAMKESKVSDIQVRLQSNKTSLTLMLTILQCKSMEEAESAMVRLCDLVEQVVAKNEEMSLRLRNIDDTISRLGQTTRPKDDENESTLSIQTVAPPHRPSINVSQAVQQMQCSFAFEEDLLATRVYRKALVSNSRASFVTYATRTTAASVLSGLSLTDISNVSILAVPVFAQEISNSNHYIFGDFRSLVLADGSQQAPIKPAGWHPRLMKAVKPNIPQKATKPDSSRKTDYSQPPKKTIMGIPLSQSISCARAAISIADIYGHEFIYGHGPILVAKVGAFLKEKALTVEDIFATGGSPARVQKLETIFNKAPHYGKRLNWARFTVHDAANILLRFLLQLPEPIIPFDQYFAFRSLWDIIRDEPKRAIKEYRELCDKLPDPSRDLLTYLLNLLALTAKKSEINKMTIRRLAAIFQPAIHLPRVDDDFIHEAVWCQDIVAFLIENEHEINYTYAKISSIF